MLGLKMGQSGIQVSLPLISEHLYLSHDRAHPPLRLVADAAGLLGVPGLQRLTASGETLKRLRCLPIDAVAPHVELPGLCRGRPHEAERFGTAPPSIARGLRLGLSSVPESENGEGHCQRGSDRLGRLYDTQDSEHQEQAWSRSEERRVGKGGGCRR